MEQQPTKVSSFLTRLLPELKVQTNFNQANLTQTAAVVFITAVLIILTYFSIKKVLK